MGSIFNPVGDITTSVTAAYVSGSIWVIVKNLDVGFFEQANKVKPTVVFTISTGDATTLSASLSAAVTDATA